MSSALARSPVEHPAKLPLLKTGQRLTQAEFHRRYSAYPDNIKAELVGGVVYMASPLRLTHGTYHSELDCAFCLYKAATPGVELSNNATNILDDANEVQADLTLRILPEWGGRSQTTKDNYMAGGVELFAEIAHGTRNLDLKKKRVQYEQAGVVEYVVVCLEDPEIRWFDFAGRTELRPNREGIYKSRVFPGLWIHGPALIARDTAQLVATVQQGLAQRTHAAFVRRLQAAQRRKGIS